jgi:hypothetical protein
MKRKAGQISHTTEKKAKENPHLDQECSFDESMKAEDQISHVTEKKEKENPTPKVEDQLSHEHEENPDTGDECFLEPFGCGCNDDFCPKCETGDDEA